MITTYLDTRDTAFDPYDIYKGVEDIDNDASGMTQEPRGPADGCLFVSLIAPETTEDSLRKFFRLYNLEPLRIVVLRDKSERALPYAYVQFMEVDQASIARLATHNRMLDGARIHIQKAKVNRTLFIAKMEKSITSAELRDLMESYGRVDHVTIIKNHQTNKSKGCGFVKFLTRDDAIKAHSSMKANKQRWVVEWATSNNDPDALGIDRNNIFIGGLNPVTTTKESLMERFSAYGKIDSISLVNKESDPTEEETESGVRSAFAFVRFNDSKSSGMAIEQQNGALWNDKRIRVQYCESQEMKTKRRVNKFYSNYYNPPYFAPMGMPMNYGYAPQMAYTVPPPPNMMYPPPWSIYNQPPPPPSMDSSLAPTPAEAHHNMMMNGGPPVTQHIQQQQQQQNGFPQQPPREGYARALLGKEDEKGNTPAYLPQYHNKHPGTKTFSAQKNELDEESKALVSSLTALSLDRAPPATRW
ncbi:hypothetical protein PROFUN_04921 [Planoprotostelium fungivorum]|uniref:RRM domain-containing protein n=1 Tax=Planoprotostelium fungivorum TaxID=1890364 RepID=A0A2P6NF73_9EUKA|nr:hypothetical protein PROFUN_04921 [Planoprotostelium fungivorum]